MCSADCWTDHRLIISKLNIHIQPQRRPQGQRVAKRLDFSKLECSLAAQELVSALDCKLADLQANSDDIEKDWKTLKTSVYSTALQVLGPATRNHQDWFDANDTEIQKLLKEKRQLLRAHQNDSTSTAKKAAFVSKRSIVQARLHSMLDAWLSSKVDEIQGFADRHDTKRFHDALMAVYGPPSCGSSPLLSADGTTLLKGKKEILERWVEHFDSVLNRPLSINNEAIARLPQVAINPDLDIPPSVEEVAKAFKQMSSGKAPGPDAIPAKVFKFGGPTLLKHRPTWLSHIQQGAKRAEEERTKTTEKKLELRKARAASVTDTAPTHMCPTCGRGFRSRIGLISHLRTQCSGSSTKK
ncbi:hypothetical protein Pcinc_025834 [Petrolisthes cinctipes]|uniref:C2H2-type domain-containing protein n=1 Tax=Petrolisthes cinctipes TaxID=88211 RepID=A0AAE1F7Z2_PETCI|nr:hypothetical protein Pcinc_025834 [Petrolisthes cinctipes]